jgi:predicted RecB family nuclease
MKVRNGTLTLTATDLANHLSCRHLTTLDWRLDKGEIAKPNWSDPHTEVLRQRGEAHEKAYVDSLRAAGLAVVDLSNEPKDLPGDATLRAMQTGVGAIVQPTLWRGEWYGRADVLLRVEQPSKLGAWSYEVVDCKLARETKAETILQLCLYCELIGELQGVAPERFHVIRPGTGFKPETYRLSSFAAFYRGAKKALSDVVAAGPAGTYPEPVPHCDVCRWWKVCDQQRRGDDHLSFVAGASKLQRKELAAHGTQTLAALAVLPLPIPFHPQRGSREGFERIREQARLQLECREEGRLKYELLEGVPGTAGLCRLPAPDAGDIFLDFEGDPFADQGGLEYLLGIVTRGKSGELEYQGRWALNRGEERQVFEWFIDFATERLARHPELHIYHYGAYEPAALKRMMLRYASREEELDRLLKRESFVDLHCVIKQSMRASVEQYSLKAMEQFCGYQRRISLEQASRDRHFLEHCLELGIAADITAASRETVIGYNEDDCRATEQLRNWLEKVREEAIAGGVNLPRPVAKEYEPTPERTERQERVAALFAALTKDVSSDPAQQAPEQAAQWLLAHALDWHQRERKVEWWEFFRMKDLSEEELRDSRTALVDLEFRKRLPLVGREKTPTDRYEYPSQECDVRKRAKLHTLDEVQFGEVIAIDWTARTVDVKKSAKTDGLHPRTVFAQNIFDPRAQAGSILRIAEWIVAHGIDAPGEYRAARDLLLRRAPRLVAGIPLAPLPDENPLQRACRLGRSLDDSVLPIQGPPGAGKTYTGAHMICELVRQGKRVGITAVSHKVIQKLLEDVVLTSLKESVPNVVCAHKPRDRESTQHEAVRAIHVSDEALRALHSGQVNVFGGTPFLWSREDFRNAVDVLFVDEAGQMSLANVLACSPAGRSLVLLGDPQQLEQPQKGSHPEGSDISALAHLLQGGTTITDQQGIFLAETRRLNPKICGFTSELFYEGRLTALAGLERQELRGVGELSGAGLWFYPVEHEGNQSYSLEEVEAVAGIVERLTAPGATWVTEGGMPQPLTAADVLIVAPFNDQVNRLSERLPGVQVGTVDKFQGQQAAVVIYSMATSSPEDAPRGMEFLYDLHRFNVATSRARCSCIVVASPRLLSPECRTPRQMELANALCRYTECSGEEAAARV